MQGLSAFKVAHCACPAFGRRFYTPSPVPRHRLLLLGLQQRSSSGQFGSEALAAAAVRRLKISPQDVPAADGAPLPLSEEEASAELAGQEAPTNDGALEEGPKVKVKFVLEKKCYFGQRFNVVGDIPQLGNWDLKAAIPLEWSEGDIWGAELDIPEGKDVEFKFVLTGEHGDIEWQSGSNRTFSTLEGISPLVVNEPWKDVEEVSAPAEAEGESNNLVEDAGTSDTSGVLVPGDFTDDGPVEEVVQALESKNGDATPKPDHETAPEVPVAELDVAATAVKAALGADDKA